MKIALDPFMHRHLSLEELPSKVAEFGFYAPGNAALRRQVLEVTAGARRAGGKVFI